MNAKYNLPPILAVSGPRAEAFATLAVLKYGWHRLGALDPVVKATAEILGLPPEDFIGEAAHRPVGGWGATPSNLASQMAGAVETALGPGTLARRWVNDLLTLAGGSALAPGDRFILTGANDKHSLKALAELGIQRVDLAGVGRDKLEALAERLCNIPGVAAE
jgi:hypothetical protein